MKSDVLVSVIIPIYNGATFLKDAIATIDAQQYEPIEIIVVDDGSTDDTAQAVAQYGHRIRYLYQENQGPAAARNHGLSIAQGDLIAFLDVDDQWPPQKLTHQIQTFADKPEVDIVNGYIQLMQATPLNSSATDMTFEEKFAPVVGFNFGSALFRRSVFEKVGAFDASQIHSEDVDWFMHARELGVSMVVLEEVTLLYRKHSTNLTHNRQDNLQGFMMAIRKSIKRRQQQGQQGQSLPQLTYLGQNGQAFTKNNQVLSVLEDQTSQNKAI